MGRASTRRAGAVAATYQRPGMRLTRRSESRLRRETAADLRLRIARPRPTRSERARTTDQHAQTSQTTETGHHDTAHPPAVCPAGADSAGAVSARESCASQSPTTQKGRRRTATFQRGQRGAPPLARLSSVLARLSSLRGGGRSGSWLRVARWPPSPVAILLVSRRPATSPLVQAWTSGHHREERGRTTCQPLTLEAKEPASISTETEDTSRRSQDKAEPWADAIDQQQPRSALSEPSADRERSARGGRGSQADQWGRLAGWSSRPLASSCVLRC